MKILLPVLCILELLLVTWLRDFAGPLISPLLLLIVSLSIGLVYFKPGNKDTFPISIQPKVNKILLSALQLLPFLVLSYLIFKTNKTIWWWNATIDSGIDKSDIIPQITTLVKRFLAHEQPYYPIGYTGYALFPTYLPFQWMPYILTEWLHKDYRWIPVIALWLATLYFFIKNRSFRNDTSIVLQLLLPVWPLATWYAIVMYDNDMFKLTVEGLVAGYYLFAASTIGGRRILPLAIGISSCLLSRYSIIFWVPLCLACYYMSGKKKEAMIVAGTALLLFTAFYWLPFLRKDPMIFIKGYQYHTIAAYGEWLNDLKYMHGLSTLYNGLGFTAWAIKLIPGDLRNVLSVYKAVHLTLCITTVCALFIYFRKHRATIDLNAFLLFSFKVYLAVFYAFIQLPYKYLYLVPVIISSALLIKAFRRSPAEYPARSITL